MPVATEYIIVTVFMVNGESTSYEIEYEPKGDERGTTVIRDWLMTTLAERGPISVEMTPGDYTCIPYERVDYVYVAAKRGG